MALEDRVKALEYELNVLKNEIHSTLLDIQEQILTHYYPSLRAEQPSPSEGVLRAVDSILTDRVRETPEERSTTLSSKVPFHGMRPAPEGSFTSRDAQPSRRPAEGTGWATFAELVEWMGHSVEKIGEERTRKVIEGYAKGGRIPAGPRDTLLQLLSLGQEETPPPKVGMKEILDVILELNAALGQGPDIGDALSLLEEEDLG